MSSMADPNLLVGASTSDDAAVYRLNDQIAIVQTVDYFTPVVDDPYTFSGHTANAGDIYAMAPGPLALNIIGFPVKLLSLDVVAEILKGERQLKPRRHRRRRQYRIKTYVLAWRLPAVSIRSRYYQRGGSAPVTP